MRSTFLGLRLAIACFATACLGAVVATPVSASTDAVPQARPRQTPPPPPAGGRPSTPRPPAAPARRPAPARTTPLAHDRAVVFAGAAYQGGTATFTDHRTFSVNRETASLTGDHEIAAGAGLDTGVFARVWRRVGLGLAVTRMSRAGTATVAGSYPHPFFFDRARSSSFEATGLDRTETGLHLSVGWIAPASRRVRLTLFAGPTVYAVSQTLVDQPALTETYPYDAITLAAGTTARRSASMVGVHAGIDATWYVTSRLGAGVLARFASGSTSMSASGGDAFDLKAGGAQIGVGLRVKF